MFKRIKRWIIKKAVQYVRKNYLEEYYAKQPELREFVIALKDKSMREFAGWSISQLGKKNHVDVNKPFPTYLKKLIDDIDKTDKYDKTINQAIDELLVIK